MSHAILDGRPVCHEPLDALCRAVWDCDCEWCYTTEQQSDGTWTHEGQVWDEVRDERAVCRSRLQTAPGERSGRYWCNVVEWIECQGLADSWLSADEFPGYHNDLDLPDGPIRFEWDDEWLSWDYAEATPAYGRFIARHHVIAWADDLGYDLRLGPDGLYVHPVPA